MKGDPVNWGDKLSGFRAAGTHTAGAFALHWSLARSLVPVACVETENAMTDALGYRAKFGVLGPSTNTIVQPEFDDLRVPGVTNHYSRHRRAKTQTPSSNETFMAGTLEINDKRP